jgi:uncharacterized membrane protein YidH (DUF202 family)
MNGLKIGALLLIAAGILGLVYGAFSYNRATHAASVGPMNITVTEHRTVNIPVWAGVGAIVVGAVLLLARRKGEA